MRGGRIVDPLGVVHLIGAVVLDPDGDPIYVATTCDPKTDYIARCGKTTQAAPTCLACAINIEDRHYTRRLFETVENIAFIQRETGGLDMVKDRIALDKLTQRLKNPPEQINNSSLYAGSPMYFYCRLCGWLADVKPESYSDRPRSHCKECEELKKANPNVTESSLKEMATKLAK